MNLSPSVPNTYRTRSARVRSISKPNFPACRQESSTSASCATVIGETEKAELFDRPGPIRPHICYASRNDKISHSILGHSANAHRSRVLRPSRHQCSRLLIQATKIRDDWSRVRRTESQRSEEHTSELQSRQYLVCRLLLEKKKQNR